MKHSTRLLSVLLAFVFVFNIMLPSAKAITVENEPHLLDENIAHATLKVTQKLVNSIFPNAIGDNDIRSFNTFFNKNNLGDMVGRLINSLNTRKEKILPSLLPIVVSLAYEELTGEKGNPILSSEEAATVIVDYLDAMLAEEGKVEIVDSVVGKVVIDYTSVDQAFSTVYKAINGNKVLLNLLGDLKNLDVSALNGVQRKGGDMNVLYALIKFLKDNETIIKKLVKGEKLDLGLAISFVKDEIQFDVAGMLLDTIYDELIKEKNGPKREDSPYKNYNADQLLNLALKNMIEKEFPFFDEGLLRQANINLMSIYSLFIDFGAVFFENLAIEPLNTDFRKSLAKLSEANYNKANNTVTKGDNSNKFYDIINWGYEFSDTSYDFDAGFVRHGGLFEQFNDVLYTILETILTKDAFTALALVPGGNASLNANIEKLVRFILPLTPAEFFHEGFDPSALSESELAAMSLEEIAALALRAVIESSPEIAKSLLSVIGTFGIPVDDIKIPENINFFPTDADINTLGKLLAHTMRGLAGEILPEGFTDLYDLALQNADDQALKDLSMDIFMDILVYYANKNLPLDLPPETVLGLKEQGWKFDHFLDELIDWVFEYTNGIFVVSDDFPAASIKRGELDENFGPWDKVNMFINALFPLDFLNVKTFEMKKVKGADMEDLIKDKLMNNFYDLDVEGILRIIKATSKKPEGPLKVAIPIPVRVGLATDVRIVSTFSQKDAERLFGLSSTRVASGKVAKDTILEVGTLLASKEYMNQKNWTTLDLNIKDNKVRKVKSNQIYRDNANTNGTGYYYFATKIKGVKETHTKELFAVGYVKYMSNGKTEVLYTSGQTYVLSDFLS